MAATNLPEFLADVEVFEGSIGPEIVLPLHKRISREGHRGVVFRTPVRSGHARANVQMSVDQPIETELDGVDPDGSETLARGAAALAALRPYGRTWITLPIPYGPPLENGHSGRAPQGMFAVTAEDLAIRFDLEVS